MKDVVTVKQRKAIELLPKHGNVVRHAMRAAGYSKHTSRNPTNNLLSRPGVQKLLDKAGLSKSFILEALKEDIKNKPGKRAKELELALKVTGLHKERHEIAGFTVEVQEFYTDLKKMVENEDKAINKKAL